MAPTPVLPSSALAASPSHDPASEPHRRLGSRSRELLHERLVGRPAWVLLTELFIGLGWARAVTEKILDTDWWSGAPIRQFVAEHDGTTVGWYRPFCELIITPFADVIAVVVVMLQMIAASTLITGRRVGAGLLAGVFLNIHFLAAGAVNPSAFYLLAQGALALRAVEAARWDQQEPRRLRQLRLAAAVALGLGALSIPFVSTFEPALVIEDPAVMFLTAGAFTFGACDLIHRRRTRGQSLF